MERCQLAVKQHFLWRLKKLINQFLLKDLWTQISFRWKKLMIETIFFHFFQNFSMKKH